jgi:phosphatidylserine decarboxylase
VDDNDENYPCFNAFFYRKLKPDARPIDFSVCPSVLINSTIHSEARCCGFSVLMEY